MWRQRINFLFCVKISKGAIEILSILKKACGHPKVQRTDATMDEAECVQMRAEGLNMNGENTFRF